MRRRFDNETLVFIDISDRIENVPDDTEVTDDLRPESSREGAGDGTEDAVDDKEGGRSCGG